MKETLRRPGFVLITTIMLVSFMLALLFAMLTLSEQRTRLVRLNRDRTIMAAEARGGLNEAAHYLALLPDWSRAAQELPSAEASLNPQSRISHRLQVVSASTGEVTVRSLAWRQDSEGGPGVTRQMEATFRRRGLSFPDASLFGDTAVVMESNARTDSYRSAGGGYEATVGTEGHVGSNAMVDPITLYSNADVQGDLVLLEGASPAVRKNAHYLDLERMREALALPYPAPPAALAASASQGDVAVPNRVVLPPGRYGNLTTEPGSELVLSGGDYLIDNLQMGHHSRLSVTGGKVRVHFRQSLEFLANTQVNLEATNQDSTTLLWLADHSQGDKPTVRLNSNCDLVGALYNPRGEVILESNSQVFGTVVGDTVLMHSFAQIHKDRSLRGVTLAADPEGGSGLRMTAWSSW